MAPGFQGRGGGGGGANDASDLTPEQRAEQAAMRQLQQIDSRITIKASADGDELHDILRERTFPINDKTVTMFVSQFARQGEVQVGQAGTQQEFSNSQTKLVQT